MWPQFLAELFFRIAMGMSGSSRAKEMAEARAAADAEREAGRKAADELARRKGLL